MSKNLSVSLRVQLQGSAVKELGNQFKMLTQQTSSYTVAVAKANKENLTLAATFKLLITEGKGFASVLGQLSGQSTLLGGRSRTLAGDVNLVGRSLQHGARDAERMRRELERLRQVPPPRPLPPNGGGSGGGNPPPVPPSPANPHHGLNTATNVGMVAAATGVAAFLVSKNNVDDSIAYNSQLMNMANTAYYDRDLKGRIAGKHELSNATLSAIRQGGGSRDQATQALNNMIASGIYSTAQAKDLLPTVQMTVTGTRASSTDLAAIGTKGGLFGYSNSKEDYLKMIDMGNLSGKQGGFELKDMAPWLPRQMGAASLSGMKGDRDFAILLSANQMAMKVAGSSDEAGNNIQNLLFKLNGQDTASDFKKMGVDLRGWLANVQQSGKNPMIAYTELIEKQLQKDPRYSKLQKEIASSKTDSERKDRAERAAAVLQGGIVGSIFQDREALKGMIALVSMKGEWLRQASVVETQYKGTTAKDAQANMQESDFKIQAFKNEWQAAADRVFTPVGVVLGNVASLSAGVLEKNEGLGNALVITTSALLIMAAAATAASMAFGRQAMMGAVAGAGGFLARNAIKGGLIGMAVGGLGYAAYETTKNIRDVVTKDSGFDSLDDTIGSIMAAFMGKIGSTDAKNAMDARLNYEANKEDWARTNIQVNLQVDGQQLTNTVETKVTREARRN